MVNTTGRMLAAQLRELGVREGDMLMVHSSLRNIGPIVGGVNVLVQALFEAVGTDGTIAAYVDFEPFFEDDDPLDDIPVFDKRIAHAARDHGVLHETLRNWPGAVRSDHPDAGVVAIGRRAEWLTADHPFHYGYGAGSPFEKFHQAGGRVLMLGAPLDTVTMLHYAEFLAEIPGKRIVRYRRRMGPDQWVDFEEFDTSDPVADYLPENVFEQIAIAFLADGKGRTGRVGNAAAHLLDSQELIPFAVNWLENFALAHGPHSPDGGR